MKKLGLYSLIILVLAIYILSANSKPHDFDAEKDIDNLLSSNYPENDPGISVLIAKDGKIIYKKAFGMADIQSGVRLSTESVFAIGSMTKQFTAVAVLKLVDEGKIDLKADMRKYLPDYNTHGRSITIENLLTHTSGIQGFGTVQKIDSKQDMIDVIQNDELLFEPGTNFSYSNSGFYLLGLIIEEVSGMPYTEFVQKNIFDPAGMRHSYFAGNNDIPMLALGYGQRESSSKGINSPFSWTWPFSAGNILSTTGDLFLWNEALNEEKIISRNMLNRAFESYTLNDGMITNYGFGWDVASLGKYTLIEHGGSLKGYMSDAVSVPEERLYIVALSNNGLKAPSVMVQKILLKLLNVPDEKPSAIPLDKNSLDQYAGAYEITREAGRLLSGMSNEKLNYFVIREGDRLLLQRSGGDKANFIPYAPDKFMTDVSDKRYDFIRDENNNVVALQVYDFPVNFGMKDYCKKVNVSAPQVSRTVDKEITLSSVEMKRLEGEFEMNPGFILKIFMEGGDLFVQATGQAKIQLYAVSPTEFFMKTVDARLEFIPDPDGSVNKVILVQGQKFECKRIR